MPATRRLTTRASGTASPFSQGSPKSWSRTWSSSSSSIPPAKSSPSAIAWPTARSIRAATTFWPPRPGLGLKRGLFEDVVVAPYATALAAMMDPRAALDNFARLEETGARGAYGFYDALDYTPSRLPEKTRVAVVRAYMAHHQGMTIVSLGNVVHDSLTQGRFHSHPMVQAAELLLQERTPRSVAVTRPRGEEVLEAAHVRDLVPPTLPRFESPHDITPRTHLLSNGRYTVMLTAAGSCSSRR